MDFKKSTYIRFTRDTSEKKRSKNIESMETDMPSK